MYGSADNLLVIGSSIFLILQSIILIDYTRSVSEEWISEYDQTSSPWRAFAMVFLSIFSYSICIFGAVWIYMHYSSDLSIVLVSINLLLIMVFTLLSIARKVQEKNHKTGLLPSAVLAMYNCKSASSYDSIFNQFCYN
jgi:hypothetical protein